MPLLNENTWSLLVTPVTVTYSDPVTDASVVVSGVRMTAPDLDEFTIEPAMLEAQTARFHLWASKLASVVPTKGGHVTAPDGRRYHVEHVQAAGLGRRFVLHGILERTP